MLAQILEMCQGREDDEKLAKNTIHSRTMR